MKRFISISLLVVFLFNVGGYYLLYLVLHHRTDQLLSARIERDQYSGEEIIELKIPVTLPYPLQETGFARVSGKFEHNGNFYKLIKQKLEHDTIFIICIRDVKSRELAKTFKDFAAKTNDLPSNSKGTLSFLGKFLKDFESSDCQIIRHGTGWLQVIGFANTTFSTHAAQVTSATPPPEG